MTPKHFGLTQWMVAVIVAIVLFGGIALTSAFNAWNTESTKEPAKYTSRELAGQNNPADIRGSYTFGDIEKAFGVPATELAVAFLLSEAEAAKAADFQVKSLEGRIEGVETDSIRWFVALYKRLPYTPEEGTYLPGKAIALLKQAGLLSPEAVATVEARKVAEAASAGEAATHTDEPVDRSIKGSTTFRAILDWGVSQEAIEKAVGGPFGPPTVPVRDYCTQKGIEFSAVKTALQALVDAAK